MIWYVLVFLSDKKKVETATSAEVSEEVNHSTSGTLVRYLLNLKWGLAQYPAILNTRFINAFVVNLKTDA